MFEAAIAGYLVSLSLIAAIGAQNAFVLRQGLRREHVAAVVAVEAKPITIIRGKLQASARQFALFKSTIIFQQYEKS